jgi:tripartite-type tricarboxylate transporter receptor subunit TctC
MIAGKYAKRFSLCALTWNLLGAGNVKAQNEPFYQGKTVRIVVGLTPGGFYDRWARLLARFMPLYIPGNPNFIVQNMAGADR